MVSVLCRRLRTGEQWNNIWQRTIQSIAQRSGRMKQVHFLAFFPNLNTDLNNYIFLTLPLSLFFVLLYNVLKKLAKDTQKPKKKRHRKCAAHKMYSDLWMMKCAKRIWMSRFVPFYYAPVPALQLRFFLP